MFMQKPAHECFFKRCYLFLEREEGKEKLSERNTHKWVASHMPPSEDVAYNPGMCPEWESNQQPFGSQASTQSTEPHQPGLHPYS